MNKTTIYIKNMVCPRCVAAVKETLERMNIPYSEVILGKAVLNTDNIDYSALNKELKKIGFELITDNNTKLAENVKNIVIDYIHHSEYNDSRNNFSDFIAKKLGKDYSHISKIFSNIEKTTIEKFIILQKIEKVKELISYNELSFSEIAFKTGYSSPAHLARQFKNITGQTLTDFKKENSNHRKPIDKI